MPPLTRLQRYALAGLGAAGGIAYYIYVRQNKKKVLASWTTNYSPPNFAKWDYNWDHREPKSLVKPLGNKISPEDENKYNEELVLAKPTAVRHLFLIRHGQYNLKGKSDSERRLTELGEMQAKWTGKRLKELKYPWTSMVVSTLTRAQQTGHLILEAMTESKPMLVEHCPLLVEGAPIPPEPAIGHWRPEATFYQDGARIEAGFRKYFHRADPDQKEDSYTMIVCHANVIRYFVCRALQFPAEAWLRLSLNHASITWISIQPSGRVILRVFGESGHIPAIQVTSQ
ncbi:serine/threonine-protein phosphatase Pgam5, mitochondrial-like isoform X2 [Ctenocephalides felis]|uniref:serine/threonine-protein phosphatase Pgam5, mitochondrial-like isoform X2 n=1 Tax=Ctenocephalides felis TaxID=7515 RepID=UPI000E6E2628|nr:serine/threonine-protein phosphatase Pgam5, mitochondrial-like isoform X2 [Ctenocephalides felis]